MQVEKKVIVTMTENDVKQVVANYLESQGHKTQPNQIKFKISEKIMEDDGLGGSYPHVFCFNGCEITYHEALNEKA